MLKLTPEQIEFKEFELGAYFFSGNIWYQKLNEEQALVVSETTGQDVGVSFHFHADRLVNVVLFKE